MGNVLNNIEDILGCAKDEKPSIEVEGVPHGVVYFSNDAACVPNLSLHFHIGELYCQDTDSVGSALQRLSELKSAQEKQQTVLVEGYYSPDQDIAFVKDIRTPISREKERYKSS